MNNYHYNKNLKQLARDLRNNQTKAENRMWYDVLSDQRFLGYKFTRQRPIDQYIVDFFCKELLLIIEIDGKSHEYDDAIIKDRLRENRLTELGFVLIRFSDWEVMNQMDVVQSLLKEKVGEINDAVS